MLVSVRDGRMDALWLSELSRESDERYLEQVARLCLRNPLCQALAKLAYDLTLVTVRLWWCDGVTTLRIAF